MIEGFGVSRVLHSKNHNFKAGDIVTGMTGWEEYSVIRNTGQLRKIQQCHDDESVPIPLSFYVGLLGMYLFYFALHICFESLYTTCFFRTGIDYCE